jgi:hypothetical protein
MQANKQATTNQTDDTAALQRLNYWPQRLQRYRSGCSCGPGRVRIARTRPRAVLTGAHGNQGYSGVLRGAQGCSGVLRGCSGLLTVLRGTQGYSRYSGVLRCSGVLRETRWRTGGGGGESVCVRYGTAATGASGGVGLHGDGDGDAAAKPTEKGCRKVVIYVCIHI